MKGEGGYSLTEVLVAITILAVAILPMASMFDSALEATGAGGDYDRARALAHRTLEEVRALDYRRAAEDYPPGATLACPTSDGKFTCEVKTEFVGEDLQPDESSKTRMWIRVSVGWEGKSYETDGLVTADEP